MDALHVHRLQARYRLVPGAAGERARLDGILDGLLADALATAATEAGLDRRAEICVRRVDAAVRVTAHASDRDVARVWAEALVGAVTRALHGADVVHYRSRRHALLDLAASGARGDTTRAWAWRQLALWEDRPLAGDHDAVERIVAALRSEPEALVAILAALARDGDALARLAWLLEPAQWRALAQTALTALGVHPEALLGPDPAAARTATALRGGEAIPEPRDGVRAAAAHVASRSEIVRALLRRAPAAVSEPSPARAVAALALVEVEPAAVRDVAGARPLLDAVAAVLRARASQVMHAGEALLGEDDGVAVDTAPDSAGRPGERGADDRASSPTEDGAPVADAPGHSAERAGARNGDAFAAGQIDGSDAAAAAKREEVADRETGEPVDAQRVRAWTQAGGLLFLLNVLDEHGLGDAIARDDVLAARPFRWSLHRLALQLAPVGVDDPAALAFAGLSPEEDPPSLGEPPPTDAELERVVDFADRIVEDLRERLERPDDAPLALLDAVCRRRAEIVADPGWIEARFSVEDADAELRRAALDLDPGWLPWLAAVVVFAYV